MKKIILTSLFLFIVISVYSQDYKSLFIDFETPDWKKYITFDTSAENIWAVSKPSKLLFNSAYLGDYAMLTDTNLYYPPNNKSSFYITTETIKIVDYMVLGFEFKLNSDTLSDFFKLAVSFDHDSTWNEIFEDSIFNKIYFYIGDDDGLNMTEKPQTISGNFDNWQVAYIDVGHLFNMKYKYTDSVTFRFSFISDSIDNKKEGVIIDYINFSQTHESINKNNRIQFNIFPNPVNNQLFIKAPASSYNKVNISVFNLLGEEIISLQNYSISEPVDMKDIKPNLYLIKISDDNNKILYVQRFIKR